MKTNQVKMGVILSYVIIVLSNLLGLLLTPYMLRSLGKSEYGLYALIGAFVGYLSVLDFGLGNTIVRYVAKYRAEGDKKGEENFLATCMLVYVVIAVIVLCVGSVLWFYLDKVFQNSLTPAELDRGKIMFAILVVNLAVSLPGGAFASIMQGYEEFVFPRMVNIARLLLRTVVIVALLLGGYKAIGIVVAETVFNLLIIGVNLAYVFGRLKTKIRWHAFDKLLLLEVFGYSFWVFLNVIMDQIYWRVGQLVLGVMLGTAVVAVFAIGFQMVTCYMQFSTAISGVFLPRVTRMVTSNASGEELTDLMIRIGRLQFISLGLLLGGFVVVGKAFVLLWAGPGYEDAWLIALLVMLSVTMPLVQNLGISILQAKKRHAFRSIICVVISVINFGIGIWLTKHYGMMGMAWATALSLIVGQIIAINLYYHFSIGLNIPRFFKELCHGLLPAFALTLCIGIASWWLPVLGIIGFILRGSAFAVVYVLTMWYFGMNNDERGLFSRPAMALWQRLLTRKA
jgi:O-antigen/teichoic acid export membrane protein